MTGFAGGRGPGCRWPPSGGRAPSGPRGRWIVGPPGKLPPLNQPKKISGPGVLRTVTDPSFLGEPVGWQLHGVASVQWALNAIETLEFAKAWLPLWEGSAPQKSD